MDIERINAQRRFDNSGPVFAAFKKKFIDLSASPVAMKTERLNTGDIIGPVWPIRYVTTDFCFPVLLLLLSKTFETNFKLDCYTIKYLTISSSSNN